MSSSQIQSCRSARFRGTTSRRLLRQTSAVEQQRVLVARDHSIWRIDRVCSRSPSTPVSAPRYLCSTRMRHRYSTPRSHIQPITLEVLFDMLYGCGWAFLIADPLHVGIAPGVCMLCLGGSVTRMLGKAVNVALWYASAVCRATISRQ